ncbi:MAG: glycerophosphodiester phosphodiesterase [Clostridiaceae bacterium]|nr:glycerophosphodiester phosphodiesterase [Clostridiaceae bacterium]
MLDLFKNSLWDFKRTYKKYIIFIFLYMLMTNFIFVPMISYVFNRMLTAMGSGVLLNSDIFKIVLSYRGIVGLAVVSILSIVVLFIEFGVLIVIAQKKYFRKNIFISDALVTTIRKTPKIIGFGLLHLILFQLFLIPFMDIPMASSLVENVDLPLFIREKVLESKIFMILYLTSFLIVIYLTLRWIFTLHNIIIEGKSTKDAIAGSLALTKHNRVKILLKLFILNLVFLTAGLLIISSITLIPSWLGIEITSYFLQNYLITFSGFIAYVFALLILPINIIFLTRLYYQFSKEQGIAVQDRLLVCESKGLKKIEKKLQALLNRRKTLILGILIANLVGTFLINYVVNENVIYLGRSILIAAHRGDPIVAPENSLSSVRAAIAKEVDFVEIDVQKTKDGIIVLNHDIDLRRMAGVPNRVSDLTYEEISKLDIGHLFGSEFAGEKIPTLAEVLEVVDGKTKLIVEIKPYGDAKALAQNVVEVIENYNMVSECYIQSFDYNILREVRKLNDDIKIGQIMYYAAGNLSALDVDFYAIEQSMLSNKLIKHARRTDREVWVWTVNEEEDIKEVLRYDIDGIITDYPERVQEIIKIH